MNSVKYKGLFAVIWLSTSTSILAAAPNMPQGITAVGTCLKKIAQDRISLTISSESLTPNPSQSSQEATQEYQKIRNEIQKMKLNNQTLETSFSVGEVKEYDGKKTVSKGYRANVSLQIETSEISRAGEILAAAVKSGAKNISNVVFFVSTEKHRLEYDSCLGVASSNAKEKAGKLAAGLGVKLGKVLSVTEGFVGDANSNGPNFGPRMAFAMAEDRSAGAPAMETKLIELSVSATVLFEAN